MKLAEETGRYLPQGGDRSGSSSTLGTMEASAAVGGILGSIFGGDDQR